MEKILEMLPLLLPLILLQLTLLGVALYHALTHNRYRVGSRPLWILLIVFVNFIGPILYFTLGKEEG